MSAASFKRLCALEEMQAEKEAAALCPFLLRQGLCCEDAVAVAHNAALLAAALTSSRLSSPRQVLKRFSLAEIAALAGEYHQLAQSWDDWGSIGEVGDEPE